MKDTQTTNLKILQTVEEGLLKSPKSLPSWLFYDDTGDKLFQSIMRMPEYYLTNCETEILECNLNRFLKLFCADGSPYELVELGPGDGTKTEILLKYLQEKCANFVYAPVDISPDVLENLTSRLVQLIPTLQMEPQVKHFQQALHDFKERRDIRCVTLFMGANIGNYTFEEAIDFVKSLSDEMKNDDMLMIGFDLKKDPRLIQAAYDDPHGITSQFNKNLLVRLNREMGADFHTDQFEHFPYYDPDAGAAISYLISMKEQDVYFDALNTSVHFDYLELIHTEISLKYDSVMINGIANAAELTIAENFQDKQHFFCDVLFIK
ncbi:L-histidine N(alpha)-methyltransferase [Bacteroidota bacterium]